jgi:hypothetical protein
MIKIGNKNKGDRGEYIGRGSALGNPFSHLGYGKAEVKVETRGESIAAFGEYIFDLLGKRRSNHKAARQLLDLLSESESKARAEAAKSELNRLYGLAKRGDVSLLCYCAPEPCHGELIRKMLEKALGTPA